MLGGRELLQTCRTIFVAARIVPALSGLFRAEPTSRWRPQTLTAGAWFHPFIWRRQLQMNWLSVST